MGRTDFRRGSREGRRGGVVDRSTGMGFYLETFWV
jgi:hypothetical protein